MIEVEVFFENHKEIIFSEISKAKSNVRIAVAWINFKEYLEIFEDLLNNKIKLSIICSDNRQNQAHAEIIQQLRTTGADIRLLKMPNINNHMHHKFAIIDDHTIINGSFNWSPNAEKSFENIMVIKNVDAAVKKFQEEFCRLLNIESDTIKNLQGVKKCKEKECGGHVYNILVFSENATKYYETYGDIVAVCDECNTCKTVKSCISDPQLFNYLDIFSGASDDYEYESMYNILTKHMETYQNKKPVIHAIGRVNTTLDGRDMERVSTNVLWKNNFVGNHVLDDYDGDFDVSYDHCSEA